MIRHRIAAALCAVFLFAPMLCGAALAAEPDGFPDAAVEAADVLAEPDPAADEPSVSAIEEKELVAPPGVGTVVEHGINGDNKEFYTIMTAEEYVFYLIIDHERAGQNVYFLNAVTLNDLVALALQDGKTVDPGSVSAIPDPNKDKPKTGDPAPEPSPDPEPEKESENSGSNMGMIVLVLVVLAGGGGAGYYFKVYRPKQQKADEADDYDYDEDEADPYGPGAESEDDGGDQAWYGEEDTAGQYAATAEEVEPEDGGGGEE